MVTYFRVPFAALMVLVTIAVGIWAGLDGRELIAAIDAGWGQRMGEFALVLLPSFTLAAALTRSVGTTNGAWSVFLGPVAGAAMVCPDTAYAALSPMGGRLRFALALGAYSGFKLLIPAGPLIVATALGVEAGSALALGLALFVPVWLAGLAWGSRFLPGPETLDVGSLPSRSGGLGRTVVPFVVLIALLATGLTASLRAWPLLDFLTQPAGALLVAASVALAGLPAETRGACIDSAIRRTASLLFLIGAASALGHVFVEVSAVGYSVQVSAGLSGLLSVFALAAAFKLIQGSSMATFAAVAAFVAPFTNAGALSPIGTVMAVCAGSIIAILPNDSFYWLVRQDALRDRSEHAAMFAIVGGSILQGLVALAMLTMFWALGVIS